MKQKIRVGSRSNQSCSKIDMNKVKIELQITGNEEDLMTLCRGLKGINKACLSGSTTTFKFIVDGDGSADLQFFVKNDEGEYEDFPTDISLDKEEYRYYIGE